MNNLVVVKFPAESRTVSVDFAQDLNTGETIASASGQSYGVTVSVLTSAARTLTRLIAVVCNSQIAFDYQNVNLDAFQTLVDSLEAGQAAVGTVSFVFPMSYDTSGGVVSWELLDKDGRVYSSGMAYGLTVENLSSSKKLTASAVINAPSDMTPTLDGQSYQVRWTLTINGQPTYSFEALSITAPYTVPQGPEDIVELEDSTLSVQVVFSKPYEVVTCAIYSQNDKLTNDIPVTTNTRVPDGQLYESVLTGLTLFAKLEDYQIVWTGYNTNRPAARERLVGRIHIVNTSILSAVADLRMAINKAHTSISRAQDLVFTEGNLLSYLRSGRDYFNGAGLGMLTSFTMLNAQGSIREFWIRCSAIAALRAQYLAEGEKAFNFGGQAITLDVDRTQYYQGLADQLKSELDAELKPYKQNLIKKGIIAGDGNLDPVAGLSQRYGAAGAVGINVTPATGWSKYGARWGVRR
jgi:hypothetical protein